jgi:N utilization substance protein A
MWCWVPLRLALAQATKKLYRAKSIFACRIDRDSGNYETFRRWLVVPDDAGLQNPDAEELLMDARERPDVEVGEYIEESIESVPIGRIGAMAAKQGHPAKIRDAEREMLLNDFHVARRKDFHRHRQAHGQGRHDCRIRSGRRAPAPQRDDPQRKPAQR